MKLLLFTLLLPAVFSLQCDYEDEQPICERQSRSIPWGSCPPGSQRRAIAFYGRKDGDKTTCSEGVPAAHLKKTNCPGDIAGVSAIVEAWCNDEGTVGGMCNLEATNDKMGGDPCGGTFKYLKVCSYCEPVKCHPKLLTCEWKYRTFKWSCPAGFRPRADVFWGRDKDDNDTCTDGVDSKYLQELNCPSNDAVASAAFENWCNDNAINGECTIRAANRKLGGDPCRGTFKYMRACTYCEDECEPKTLTCEWKYRTFKWSCPAGQVPKADVFWGRDKGDNDTCTDGVDPVWLQNLNCPSDDAAASAAFEDWCNKNAVDGMCTIRAANRKLGGDPCRGTFKYMRACTYCEDDCQPKTLTCEWKYRTFDWKCPAGKRPKADVFWGRVDGDNDTCTEGVDPKFLQNLDCPSNNVVASAAFETWCNDNEVGGKCTIRAANRKLGGDPCRGTFKYMRACTYCEDMCHPKTLTCEWKQRTFKWHCGKGEVPKADVFWGRDNGDNETCTDGVDPGFLQNLNCPSNDAVASAAFESWCNLNHESGWCKFTAANGKLGGDPCKGTFKYMRACTYCKPGCDVRAAPVTCEWKSRKIDWKCPAGEKPKALAFWGRRPGDNETCTEGVDPVYLQNLDCPGDPDLAAEAVQTWCDDNAEDGICEVKASYFKLKIGGERYDPCRGTFKYLQVCTYCKPIGPKTVILLDCTGSMASQNNNYMHKLVEFLDEFFDFTSTNNFWNKHLTNLDMIPFTTDLLLDSKVTIDYCDYASATTFRAAEKQHIEDFKNDLKAKNPVSLTNLGKVMSSMMAHYAASDVYMVYLVSDFINIINAPDMVTTAGLVKSNSYQMFPVLLDKPTIDQGAFNNVVDETIDDLGIEMAGPNIPDADFQAIYETKNLIFP